MQTYDIGLREQFVKLGVAHAQHTFRFFGKALTFVVTDIHVE